MTNQAAQTMPELPKAWGFARNVDGQIEIRIGPVCPPNRSGGLATPWAPMFGGDQMHQYARDYAAMLAAAPAASGVHPDALPDGTLSKSTAKRVEALAASGGEDGWSLAMRVREALDRASCPDHFMRIAVETITGDAPHPPAAASVSERARALMAQAYRDGGYPYAAGTLEAGVIDSVDSCALSAIEQALTQQRGDGEAVDRDAWAEALELPEGYTVEEFLPGGWHYAWTRSDGERMVSGTTWNHPALAAIAAWQYAPATTPSDAGGEAVAEPFAWFAWGDHNGPVPLELFGWDEKACKYAVLTYARSQGWKGTVTGFLLHNGWTLRPAYATTPQPSADAVRELVKRILN